MMPAQSRSSRLPTFVTTAPAQGQRLFATAVCILFAVLTIGLLPTAATAIAPIPAFVPSYQTALVVVYAVTTYLFFAQYRRTRSAPLLVLGSGSLYTALIVLVQFLTFPNVFTTGRLLGSGSGTTAWLWVFWHAGPPLFAVPYALMSGGDLEREVDSGRVSRIGWAAAAAAIVCVLLITVLTTRYVFLLPDSAEGDSYRPLTTSGIGPAVVALTILSLAVLCRTTRLRTVLQLWLAVSLFLLVFDNWITLAGAARGTIGWLVGRLEALIAGCILLGIYLAEVDFLYGRAQHTAREQDRERAALQVARDHLTVALDAAEMSEWDLDLTTGRSRRGIRHDHIFGDEQSSPHWGKAEFLRHVVAEDRPMAEAAFARIGAHDTLDLRCRITRANDGAMRWIAVKGKICFDETGRATTMTGVIMDTSERHAAEERSAQAQKMEAVGLLTGGVAHDFNNLLTIVVGSLDIILRAPENTARVLRLANSAMVAAQRGAAVTEKLLAFSRRQILRPETVNPNRLLKDFKPILSRAVGETIAVEMSLDAALDPVRLDAGQFESAMLNLALNARDALPNGGTLTLTTENIALAPEDLAGMPELAPGDYVRVRVADTGTGMDAETVAHAFEPFFTTKDVGRGSGLGLSQVYGFVKQAGGHVAIKSAVGSGTSIEMYLPRSVEKTPGNAVDMKIPLLLRRADDGEVILVVEDEAAVLDMAVESLRELGYKTLTATNAAEALNRLNTSDRIDILFSDVVMPGGMNGVQLAVEARRLKPGLRVLLTSGYTGASLAEKDLPKDVPLLSKPYQRQDLASKLRVVLGRP